MNLWYRVDNAEIKLYIYGQMIFRKNAKKVISRIDAGATGYLHAKQWTLPRTIYKN